MEFDFEFKSIYGECKLMFARAKIILNNHSPNPGRSTTHKFTSQFRIRNTSPVHHSTANIFGASWLSRNASFKIISGSFQSINLIKHHQLQRKAI